MLYVRIGKTKLYLLYVSGWIGLHAPLPAIACMTCSTRRDKNRRTKMKPKKVLAFLLLLLLFLVPLLPVYFFLPSPTLVKISFRLRS